MGLLDKVKNLFTEEVEVEVKEPEKKGKKHKEKEQEEIQKEVIQVEIPSPAESAEEKEVVTEEKEEYKFPYFDDDDFDMIDLEKPIEEEKPKTYHEVYNPPKEEKKVFKPSPIISPVYGFLDKNYQKEELIQKTNEYNPRKASVDEIRDKAYGSLESDIETTLFGNNRVLFEEKNEKDETEKIKEEKSIDEITDDYNSNTIKEKPRHQSLKEDDLTDLLEAEMSKSEKTEKRKPRKISDKELFNLIDSMYEGEIKWWLMFRNYLQHSYIYY